jgi:type II secretory pathway pseudopilin PulG
MMIVVAVIGMLATFCIPAAQKARSRALGLRFINDVRTAKFAFIQYSLETGKYPPDTTPGILPDEMGDYLRRIDWKGKTPIGGSWDWDNGQFGIKAGVSVYRPTARVTQAHEIDAFFDDGDLTTGDFRARSSGYISIIED